MRRTLLQLMSNSDAVLLMSDDGIAGALAYSHYFNAQAKTTTRTR